MKRFIYTVLISVLFIAGLYSPSPANAAAAYSVGFQNSHIRITSPQTSGVNCNGTLSISGTSDLQTIWFCIRSPRGELIGSRAEVNGGCFDTALNLQLGAGEYTIWAGDNSQSFDGSIRFLVENREMADNRYTTASCYVDCDNPEVAELAQSLAPSSLDDRQKLNNIHDWITHNISYDCAAYKSGDNTLIKASQVLKSRTGMCREYAFLLAALCRDAGLPARVVYGNAVSGAGSGQDLHAWNEVKINGEWLMVDSCWDAGYVANMQFVSAPSTKFLAPSQAVVTATHTATTAVPY